MILAELKNYLTRNRRATLGDLACHFDIAPEAIKGMLGQWIKKGKVARLDGVPDCCRGCGKCHGGINMELYEWIN